MRASIYLKVQLYSWRLKSSSGPVGRHHCRSACGLSPCEIHNTAHGRRCCRPLCLLNTEYTMSRYDSVAAELPTQLLRLLPLLEVVDEALADDVLPVHVQVRHPRGQLLEEFLHIFPVGFQKSHPQHALDDVAGHVQIHLRRGFRFGAFPSASHGVPFGSLSTVRI